MAKLGKTQLLDTSFVKVYVEPDELKALYEKITVYSPVLSNLVNNPLKKTFFGKQYLLVPDIP